MIKVHEIFLIDSMPKKLATIGLPNNQEVFCLQPEKAKVLYEDVKGYLKHEIVISGRKSIRCFARNRCSRLVKNSADCDRGSRSRWQSQADSGSIPG